MFCVSLLVCCGYMSISFNGIITLATFRETFAQNDVLFSSIHISQSRQANSGDLCGDVRLVNKTRVNDHLVRWRICSYSVAYAVAKQSSMSSTPLSPPLSNILTGDLSADASPLC